jgi:hypothetical protein
MELFLSGPKPQETIGKQFFENHHLVGNNAFVKNPMRMLPFRKWKNTPITGRFSNRDFQMTKQVHNQLKTVNQSSKNMNYKMLKLDYDDVKRELILMKKHLKKQQTYMNSLHEQNKRLRNSCGLSNPMPEPPRPSEPTARFEPLESMHRRSRMRKQAFIKREA